MSIFTVIPVKTLLKSKTRLSTILTPHERQTLLLKMLEDVCNAIQRSSIVHKIVIISSDLKVQSFSNKFRAVYLQEIKEGLNQALQQATNWCIQNNAKSILIIPTDIPLISPDDIKKIVNLSIEECSIVIAPSKNGGTNILFQKPPDLIPPCYGPESFYKHIIKASDKGVAAKIYTSQNVELDIDTPKDLENLIKFNKQTVTHRFLKKIRFNTRLKTIQACKQR
jgi:2-phospho-L-lactate guanylyltransferase